MPSEEPLRVLFAIGSMGGGGAERQVIHYLKHLDRERFTPLLYLTEHRGELLSHVPEHVPVLSFSQRHPAPPRWQIPGQLLRRQIRDLATVLAEERIDQMCAVTFYLTLVAGASVRRRPTPWMAVEMADPRLDFDTQTDRFRWLKSWLLMRAYRSADLNVAVSNGVREGLCERYQLSPERVCTLPNFVDVGEIDRQADGPGPQLDPAKFHVVNVGRLHVQKGQRYLIDAIAQLVHEGLTHVHLHLLGQGPLEAELRNCVHERQLDAYVTFAGFVENPFSYLRQCQLFCLPSLFEGLPLALLEAMCCRVPVIAADCRSGPAEILDGGRFGCLVPPGETGPLAEALRAAVQKGAGRSCVDAARSRVEQHFSVQAVMPQLEQLLDRLRAD
jgi:glycosyltransferase involved in cell wall biosynthesis